MPPLGGGMEMNMQNYSEISQRNFVSTIEHWLKNSQDKREFVLLLEKEINLDELFSQNQLEKLYFIIALLEYLSDKYHINISEKAKKYSNGKLDTITYPEGIELYCQVVGDNSIKEMQLKSAIPQFLKYNLVITNIEGVA